MVYPASQRSPFTHVFKQGESMSSELVMLGTGCAMVTRCYNTCFAIRHNKEYLLVDGGGGNGILVQLQHAGIPLESIKQIFVTHSHTDHVLGVIWVIRKMASDMVEGTLHNPVTIYCHPELAECIRTICRLTLPPGFFGCLDSCIRFQTVCDGEAVDIAGMQVIFLILLQPRPNNSAFVLYCPIFRRWSAWETNPTMNGTELMSKDATGCCRKLSVFMRIKTSSSLTKNIIALLWMPALWPRSWGFEILFCTIPRTRLLLKEKAAIRPKQPGFSAEKYMCPTIWSESGSLRRTSQ